MPRRNSALPKNSDLARQDHRNTRTHHVATKTGRTISRRAVKLQGNPSWQLQCCSRRELLRAVLAAYSCSHLGARGSSSTRLDPQRSPFVALNPAATGIQFRHQNGGAGAKEMIETMGSGCALLDYDNDGLLDLYLVNGAALPSIRKEDPIYFNRLYRNLGGFRFVDVTVAAAVQGNGYGMGAAVGDYDNDGYPDLYLTNFGSNQ